MEKLSPAPWTVVDCVQQQLNILKLLFWNWGQLLTILRLHQGQWQSAK
jgi:hypothetical protein